MKNFMNNAKNKANGMVIKMQMMKANAKNALCNERGENYVDSGVKILIAVVLGALLLAGLYALFNDTIMPTLVQRIEEMFDYAG